MKIFVIFVAIITLSRNGFNTRPISSSLGKGFAFVGSQHPLRVSNQNFRIDLLFCHVKLYCYVVIELKVGKLKPAHGSQLNFYLSTVDDLIKIILRLGYFFANKKTKSLLNIHYHS